MKIQEIAKTLNNNYKKETENKNLTVEEKLDILEAVIENLITRVNYLEGK